MCWWVHDEVGKRRGIGSWGGDGGGWRAYRAKGGARGVVECVPLYVSDATDLGMAGVRNLAASMVRQGDL